MKKTTQRNEKSSKNKAREAGFADLDRLKRLTIIGLFSDDTLADLLVLKGGNALSLVYELGHRGSLDLDFSIEDDFSPEVLGTLETRMGDALNKAFEPEGLVAFDVKIEEVPPDVTPDMAPFWGGYVITFKLITSGEYLSADGNMDQLRRRALVTGPGQVKKVQVEISKHEFCGQREVHDMDGLKVSVYSPAMIICEKLRAICQQTEDYCNLVKRSPRARARDFYDVYATMQKYGVDLGSPEARSLLRDIFGAKRVPLRLLGQMRDFAAFHAPDWDAVRGTVPPGIDLKSFEFYCDFVLRLCEALKPFGK